MLSDAKHFLIVEFLNKRKLKYICKKHNVSYQYVWRILKNGDTPSYSVMEKFKSLICIDKWFTYDIEKKKK